MNQVLITIDNSLESFTELLKEQGQRTVRSLQAGSFFFFFFLDIFFIYISNAIPKIPYALPPTPHAGRFLINTNTQPSRAQLSAHWVARRMEGTALPGALPSPSGRHGHRASVSFMYVL